MEITDSFQTLKLKISYDSDEDENIVTDFFLPVLERSIEYFRVTGSFSSSSLLVAARGIAGLILNDGKMKLVADARLRSCDIEAIQLGEEMTSILSNKILLDMKSIETEIAKDHIAALGWLIATKRLEIKVIIMLDDDGNLIPTSKSRKMFHPKIGIFKDTHGNLISFSGSINESITGWTGNIEEFKVYKGWESIQSKYLNSDLAKFKKYWQGALKKAKTYDIPLAVKEHLIELAPKSLEAMKSRLLRWYRVSPEIKQKNSFPLLWNHQIEAIEAWTEANGKGIWQMATGSGKTLAAIEATRMIYKELKDSLMVLVVCPYTVLVNQWTTILNRYQENIWKMDKQWKNNIRKAINYHLWGSTNLSFIVLTYNKLANPNIHSFLEKCKNLMIIADEVHNFGSKHRQAGMLEIFKFRLGLSATPERWFDEEGSQNIKEYFNNIIYEYKLEQAINDGFLVPYDYYPHIIELDNEETREYINVTNRIKNKRFLIKNNDVNLENLPESLKNLFIRRGNIIRNARKKMLYLKELITNKEIDLDRTLIYCGTLKQISQVQSILNEHNFYQHQRYTANETEQERNLILNQFEKGKIKVLVAIKCLDEGLDIPSIKNAIIIASTTNPREFIQRRGRVLRNFQNKKYAVIHDFLIIPGKIEFSDYDFSQLYKRELQRYIEFTAISRNPEKATSILLEIKKTFKT